MTTNKDNRLEEIINRYKGLAESSENAFLKIAVNSDIRYLFDVQKKVKQKDKAIAELEKIEGKYEELITAVKYKWQGLTRHEVALTYITEREYHRNRTSGESNCTEAK